MGRNLDLDNCPNKQEAVLAAYAEELEENERKIVRRRSVGDKPGYVENQVLASDFDEILSAITISRTT